MWYLLDDKMIEKLTKKAVHGHAESYGKLIEHYKEYLYKTAMLSTKNEDIALDVVGDCILKGFQSIKGLREAKYFKTWITRILYNAINDYYRKEFGGDNIENVHIAMPEEAVSSEEKMDLYQAIDMLSEKYRTVIILKYFDELKVSEIAYVMDIPVGSVKAYLSRAREELKYLLMEEDLYEDGISEYTSIRETGSSSGEQFGASIYPKQTQQSKVVGY